MRTLLYLILFGGLTSPAWGAANEWVVNGPSRVRLITPYAVAPAEGEVRMGVEMRLEEGWHSYWKNSGDAGYAPTVEVAGPMSGVELLYPVPRRFDLPGELVAFGYADEVLYPLRGRLAARGEREVRLTAEVDYVVCAEECIPYQASLALRQPVGEQAVEDPETAPVVRRWWGLVPRTVEEVPGVETSGRLVADGGGGPALEVRVRGVEAAPGTQVFFAPHDLFELGRPEARPVAGGVVFRAPLASRQAGMDLPARIPFEWTVTGLARGGEPLAIEARRQVAGVIQQGADEEEPTGVGDTTAGGRGALSVSLAAAAAVAATLAALYLWGILGVSAAREQPEGQGGGWRGLLGFAAAGGTVWALLGLAHVVHREALVGVELALLGLALCAWLRRRAAGRGMLPAALTVGLLACAAAAVWLAHRGQL